jgi:hypothetical protein
MATPLSLIRRLTLSILMPFILLLSQQGALMHELSHWHPVTVSASSGPEIQALDVDHDICLTCLSFGQIGGLAKIDALAAPKVDGLRYHFASELVRHVAESSLPVARSRGPPLSV